MLIEDITMSASHKNYKASSNIPSQTMGIIFGQHRYIKELTMSFQRT